MWAQRRGRPRRVRGRRRRIAAVAAAAAAALTSTRDKLAKATTNVPLTARSEQPPSRRKRAWFPVESTSFVENDDGSMSAWFGTRSWVIDESLSEVAAVLARLNFSGLAAELAESTGRLSAPWTTCSNIWNVTRRWRAER
jgi:hypothetical protein